MDPRNTIQADYPFEDPRYTQGPNQDVAYADDDQEAFYPEYAEQKAPKVKRLSVDSWMANQATYFPRFKRRTIALFFLRLPAFVPWFFILRGWLSLNAKDVLTLSEADVLGTGGEATFLIAVSITPLITLTGARWYAPLRRWYGIFFALIGISDATTAAITTTFSGGVFGRLAGHTFLVTGFLIVLIAIPLLLTANTPAQRKLGTYWKKLQKMTYVIWGFVVLHLALLDGFKPFDGPQGDGDPVFHQRFYQYSACSLFLLTLRLPPVKRWIVDRQKEGRNWLVWVIVTPIFALFVFGFIFILNEEIFKGVDSFTEHPSAE